MNSDMYKYILAILQQHDGFSLDNSEQREKLARVISDKLVYQGDYIIRANKRTIEVNLNIWQA